MSAVTVLRCDGPGCGKQYREIANVQETRRRASLKGWRASRANRQVDYCPAHVSLRTNP